MYGGWSSKLNPLHPSISIHILHTVLYRVPEVLTRRICWTIKSLFSWWSFLLFLWPLRVIQGGYYREMLDASHSQGEKDQIKAAHWNIGQEGGGNMQWTNKHPPINTFGNLIRWKVVKAAFVWLWILKLIYRFMCKLTLRSLTFVLMLISGYSHRGLA